MCTKFESPMLSDALYYQFTVTILSNAFLSAIVSAQ